jgi:ribosomal protein L34E
VQHRCAQCSEPFKNLNHLRRHEVSRASPQSF